MMIPFYTLFRREVARFLKVIVQTVVTPLVSSVLYLLVFGVSLGANVKTQQNVDYLAFLIPGLLMMGLMNNAFQNSSSSVVNAKWTGELEDWRVAPISAAHLIWAIAFGAVVRGAVVGGVTLVVGLLFYYLKNGVYLPFAHPFIFIYFIIMGGLVFGKLGLGAAFWAKTFDQLSAVSAFLLLPLTYLGGVFMSIENLHPIWQTISKFNPMLYFINGMRYSLLGVSDVPIENSMIVVFISLIVFHIFSRWSLARGSFQRW